MHHLAKIIAFSSAFMLLSGCRVPIGPWIGSCDLGPEDGQIGPALFEFKVLAATTDGRIYMVGGSPLGDWIVRGRTQGSAFKTLDTFNLGYTPSIVKGVERAGSHGMNEAMAVAVDPAGNIYVVGGARAPGESSSGHWIVRKSSDRGVSWTTVDDFLSTGVSAFATSVSLNSTGDIYVSGGAVDSDSNAHWIVRKSSDAGTTWKTVDDVPSGVGWSVISDSNSNIWVVGNRHSNGTTERWLTRVSRDAGQTWVTVDDVAGEALSVASDGANLYVSGRVLEEGSYQTQIRKTSDQGTSWIVTKISSGNSGFYSVAADLLGNVFDIFWPAPIRWDSPSATLEKSSDHGLSWKSIASGNISAIQVGADGLLYLLSRDPIGNLAQLQFSLDGGSQWTVLDQVEPLIVFQPYLCL